MLEKKTVLNQVEILPSGVVQVRFEKLIVEAGKVLRSEWHRTTIEPGVDVDEQIAVVNGHLAALGEAPVEDYQLAKDHAKVAHTPERVKKFRDERARREVPGQPPR